MANFLDLVQKRRTHYGIGKNTELSNQEIVEYLTNVAKDVPSASNSQTSRLAIVFGDQHVALWDLILDTQKNVLSGDMWEMMSGVMEGAKQGVGTVVFFEDRDAVAAMPTSDATRETYKQNNAGNTQYATWLALADLDLGGSLQHMNLGYEQGFDKSVRELLGLPDSWEMTAQMPFGSVEDEVGAKEYIADEDRVRVIGE